MSIKKYKKNKGYESISREFLQRNDLSLEARGLLAYMQSMPEDYVFHKTQLYRCFDKNKKTCIERIWNELLDAQYIIAFSKGKGPRQEYEYIYSQEGFSDEAIHELNGKYLSEGWEIAYRSGSNRKSTKYYKERSKEQQLAKLNEKVNAIEPSKGPSNHKIENAEVDNSAVSCSPLGVDFEQLKTNRY